MTETETIATVIRSRYDRLRSHLMSAAAMCDRHLPEERETLLNLVGMMDMHHELFTAMLFSEEFPLADVEVRTPSADPRMYMWMDTDQQFHLHIS